MNGSGLSRRALPALLAVAGLLLTGCGVLGGGGGTATATVTTTVAASGTEPAQVTPSAGGGPSPETSDATQTVDPDDPQGAAERFGVTLVDPGEAGMVQFGSVFFTSPSGRISCAMTDDDDVNDARCDIRDATFTPPRKPADCDLDWGQAVSLQPDDAAGFACVGDTVAQGDGVVLGYGEGVVLGGIICFSRESGMTCRTTGPPDHGFTLSRARYSLD